MSAGQAIIVALSAYGMAGCLMALVMLRPIVRKLMEFIDIDDPAFAVHAKAAIFMTIILWPWVLYRMARGVMS